VRGGEGRSGREEKGGERRSVSQLIFLGESYLQVYLLY
jgi:hypothetical protein